MAHPLAPVNEYVTVYTPAVLVLGLIFPVEEFIVNPAVELKLVPVNGPPVTDDIVTFADVTL